MPVKPIPDGFHTITPYMMVKDAQKLIDFLKHTFGAKVLHDSRMPDGKVMHVQMQVGTSMVMMTDACGEWEPMPSSIYVYVEDCDAVFKRALDAGGTVIMPVADQFYGDRSGGVKDPCGNMWWLATHIEDVSKEEMDKRAQAAMTERGGQSK